MGDFLRTADTTGWRLRRERLRWLWRRVLGWGLFVAAAVLGTVVVAMTLDGR